MKKNVLVGVCAGIASYKTCELVRFLVKDGFNVKVIMTESSTKFVSPLVFQTLSENPVYLDMFSLAKDERVKHIEITEWTDICVAAPLTANTLSKIANGICDNLLTTVICALPKNKKIIFAPAMNTNMWENPLIQENVGKLKKLKRYIFLNPGKGFLACGAYGEGRMPEPEEIYNKIKAELK
ncbi:MAG: flavoprotein [Candidatus Omnitrophota bacterium]|jgi:phosphopantothenoylcysteine decarboxylase/phosphopantothenate--cysteine ligase